MKRFMAVTKRKATSSTNARPVKRRKRAAVKKTYTAWRPSTLQRMEIGHPFPRTKKTVMVYDNALTQIGGSANLLTAFVASNSLFDFDKSGSSCFGNKQPLYMDTLMTASGPYRRYRVNSWRTTFTVINDTSVPLNVWILPPVTATGEIDSAAEADNFPGVVKGYLTEKGGSKQHGSWSVVGNIKDITDDYNQNATLQALYNADPATIAYGGVVVQAADGTTAAVVYVAVHHEFDVQLSEIDALVS